jgi:6,7-dimethyl-8-ribityllumazine synthase
MQYVDIPLKVMRSMSISIPEMANRLLLTSKYAGLLALGCLIRGETDHYDLLTREVTKGLAQLSLNFPVPVTFGVVTADNLDQALARAGSKQGNKGFEAALSLIEMCDMYNLLKPENK